MSRVLWFVVATLVVIAIGAPCLTFYLLIKEYWTEVEHLREELLRCQLGSPRSTPDSSSRLQSPPSRHIGNVLHSLPVPERLTSHRTISTTLSSNHIETGVLGSDSQNPDSLGKFQHKDTSDRPQDFQDMPDMNDSGVQELSVSLKPFHQILPSNTMIADEVQESKISTKNSKKLCVSRSYVEKLEKSTIDLSARIEACRQCLPSGTEKEGRCGGGPTWRKHRRKEKLAKKEIKEQKRKRRKKEKRKKDGKERKGVSMSPTEGGESMTDLQSDITSLFGIRVENQEGEDAHEMRENHRASTDFRRGFNQKIVRMDEALMQFTETQSAFCKELRDNLGGSLEKRGQELEALSEQIAALVRTTTAQVTMIEKLTSDQVYAGQASIEKNLEKLQTLRDERVRAVQSFHKQIILPTMVTLTSLLGEQASSVTNMGVDLITKVEMLQDLFLTFSTQQGDNLIKLAEEVDMFALKHGNQISRSRDHAKRLHMSTENFIRELQTRMNNVVKELVLVRLQSQSFVSVNENTYHEISSSLNNTNDAVETLAEDLQRRIQKAKTEEKDFRADFTQETDYISERIESGISDVLIRNHAAVAQTGEAELETRVFSDAAEASWNEMYVNQETELRQEADMLTNNLRSHAHHTQNILTGLQGTAGTHEQVLEQQRMDFQSFVRKRQDALDTQCSAISDWAFLMSSELRRRDEDLHRFLSEDIHLSPVSVQGLTDYGAILAAGLPDGSLAYNSTSADNFPPSGIFPSNSTAVTEEVAHSSGSPNSLSVYSTAGDYTTALPNSSLSNLPSLSPEQGSGTETTSFTREDLPPLRGDANGGDRSKGAKEEVPDTGDNAITHQNDQGATKDSLAAGNKCFNSSTNFTAKDIHKNDGHDDFKKLKNILLQIKQNIFRLQRDFEVGNADTVQSKSFNKMLNATNSKRLRKENNLNYTVPYASKNNNSDILGVWGNFSGDKPVEENRKRMDIIGAMSNMRTPKKDKKFRGRNKN